MFSFLCGWSLHTLIVDMNIMAILGWLLSTVYKFLRGFKSGRPFVKLVSSIPQPCLMCVFESCEVMLRNSETTLLHYSIHFMQCTRFIGSKTTPSMMLPPPCLIAGTVFLELSTSPLLVQTYLCHCGQTTQSKSHLYSRRLLIFPNGQLQSLVELEGVDFGEGASFLDCSLSIHSYVKLAWL